MNQIGIAKDEIGKAFEFRDRVTKREQLHISAFYYDIGTGDIDKAMESYQEWIQTYHEMPGRIWIGRPQTNVGQYDQALPEMLAAIKLEPDDVINYDDLESTYIALGRFDEAQNVINDAESKKLDDVFTRENIYGLAFIRSDAKTIQDIAEWAAGKPGIEDVILAMEADTQAYSAIFRRRADFPPRLRTPPRETAQRKPPRCGKHSRQCAGGVRRRQVGSR